MEEDDVVISDNNAYLMAMGEGSRIEIHAVDREKESWTELSETAEAGSNELKVTEATGWQVGDLIAIASTSDEWTESEEFTVLDISDDGMTITLDSELTYSHQGETVHYENGLTGEDALEWDVEIRAEVALLSRNVTIQGDEDSVDDGYGAHTMVMDGAEQYIEGAEYYRVGQVDELGRYPIHWHMLGDAEGQYVEGVSVHDSYQKGSTIHGTSNIRYEDNVIYNTVGHGVFFEDGSENGNQIITNLVFISLES
jgi:cell migration-inducing and hyaluronan-binding protein